MSMKSHSLDLLPQSKLDPLANNQSIFKKSLYIPIKVGSSENAELTPITFDIRIDKAETRLTIYLLSDSDIFFLYSLEVSGKDLKDYHYKYKIKCQELKEFVEYLWKVFEQTEKKQNYIVISIVDTVNLIITISRNWNSKNFVLLELIAKKQKPQITKRVAAYRYGTMRQDISQLEKKIVELKEIVKVKNPYLMSFINKI